MNRHVVGVTRSSECGGVSELYLVRERVDAAREGVDGVLVVEVGDDLVAGDRRGRTRRRRVEDDHVDTKRCRRLREHPSELAAADDAEGRAGQSDRHLPTATPHRRIRIAE